MVAKNPEHLSTPEQEPDAPQESGQEKPMSPEERAQLKRDAAQIKVADAQQVIAIYKERGMRGVPLKRAERELAAAEQELEKINQEIVSGLEFQLKKDTKPLKERPYTTPAEQVAFIDFDLKRLEDEITMYETGDYVRVYPPSFNEVFTLGEKLGFSRQEIMAMIVDPTIKPPENKQSLFARFASAFNRGRYADEYKKLDELSGKLREFHAKDQKFRSSNIAKAREEQKALLRRRKEILGE